MGNPAHHHVGAVYGKQRAPNARAQAKAVWRSGKRDYIMPGRIGRGGVSVKPIHHPLPITRR
jgi:hypothetical protein